MGADQAGEIEDHNFRDIVLRVTAWFPTSTFGVPPI
jgi:hypothetical protein